MTRHGAVGLEVICCVVILLAAVAGCTANSAPPPQVLPGRAIVSHPVRRALRFWTRGLLGSAGAVTHWRAHPKTAHPVMAPPGRVGALFFHNASGNHFCTASVVDSPRNDVIVTAAHCVHTGKDGDYQQDVVFVPGYHQGQTPYGVWQPTTIIVDQRWVSSSDPDLDVAFLVVAPQNGKNIGEILGGNQLAINQPDPMRVRVTGYPNSSDTPITCSGHASAQSATQQRFACGGYATGTSGSPWITDYSPHTNTGRLVGVIGGYQQGGDTPDISYSPAFGADIQHLYQQATAQD